MGRRLARYAPVHTVMKYEIHRRDWFQLDTTPSGTTIKIARVSHAASKATPGSFDTRVVRERLGSCSSCVWRSTGSSRNSMRGSRLATRAVGSARRWSVAAGDNVASVVLSRADVGAHAKGCFQGSWWRMRVERELKPTRGIWYRSGSGVRSRWWTCATARGSGGVSPVE